MKNKEYIIKFENHTGIKVTLKKEIQKKKVVKYNIYVTNQKNLLLKKPIYTSLSLDKSLDYFHKLVHYYSKN